MRPGPDPGPFIDQMFLAWRLLSAVEWSSQTDAWQEGANSFRGEYIKLMNLVFPDTYESDTGERPFKQEYET